MFDEYSILGYFLKGSGSFCKGVIPPPDTCHLEENAMETVAVATEDAVILAPQQQHSATMVLSSSVSMDTVCHARCFAPLVQEARSAAGCSQGADPPHHAGSSQCFRVQTPPLTMQGVVSVSGCRPPHHAGKSFFNIQIYL